MSGMRVRWYTAMALLLMLAGCVESGGGDECDDVGASCAGPQVITQAPTPANAVLSIKTTGGYVPIEVTLRDSPSFLLLADGTAIIKVEPTAGEYVDQPALASHRTSQLTKAQVADLWQNARAAGIFGPIVDYGEPGITDMPTTFVTLTDNGKVYRQSAYALGSEHGQAVSADQQKARDALQGFIDAATKAAGKGQADFQPQDIAVYRQSSESTYQRGKSVPWPIATVPPEASEADPLTCVVVSGAEAQQLFSAAQSATLRHGWSVNGAAPATFVFRVVLPGEPGCDA